MKTKQIEHDQLLERIRKIVRLARVCFLVARANVQLRKFGADELSLWLTRFDTVSFPPMSENTQSSRRMTSDSVSKSLKFPSKPPNARRGRL